MIRRDQKKVEGHETARNLEGEVELSFLSLLVAAFSILHSGREEGGFPDLSSY